MMRFYYFGCRGTESGHFLHGPQTSADRDYLDVARLPVYLLDGTFAPLARIDTTWKLTHLSMSHHVISILAKHDYTIDRRPGSNACFVAVDTMPWDQEEILAEAKVRFPDCWKRLVLPGGG